MTKKIALFGAASLVASTSAHAVLVGVAIGNLSNSAGLAPSASSKTIAIVDVDGDGLAGFDLATWDGSSFLPDADDWIVEDLNGSKGAWNESTGDGDGFEALVPPAVQTTVLDTNGELYDFDAATNAANTPAIVGGGDNVYLFWFPELPSGATAPGAGQEYGVILLGQIPDGFGTLSPNLLSSPVLTADNTTIPEPTSLALLGLGGLLVARRRRA